MRRYLLDYVRCALCGRTAARDSDLGGWMELTFPTCLFGKWRIAVWRKNVCPEDVPKLGWPHHLRNTDRY